MQYRTDPKTGNKLSILGLGCMRFPTKYGRIDMEKTETLVMEAIQSGVNYFDTAYIYAGSEAALGSVLSKNGVRDKVYIATKLPIMMCRTPGDFEKYFTAQLERLKTDRVDYYFLHMLTNPAQWKQLCGLGIVTWLEEKKAQGQIKQVGFSFHGSSSDFITLLDAYDWDFCQIQYNYIQVNYQAGVTGLQHAAAKGLPVFIMEPLLGGRLATGLPEEAVRIFHEAEASRKPADWALRWVWNQPAVTVLLSGMRDVQQLAENVKTAEDARPSMLTTQEQSVIDQVVGIFNASYKVPCTGCNYCMPCPQNVNIPACFAAYNNSYAMSKFSGMKQYMQSTGAVSSSPGNARRCIQCGKCEKHCPQQIPIRDSLLTVGKRMEPIWYRSAVSVFRRFIRVKGSG